MELILSIEMQGLLFCLSLLLAKLIATSRWNLVAEYRADSIFYAYLTVKIFILR